MRGGGKQLLLKLRKVFRHWGVTCLWQRKHNLCFSRAENTFRCLSKESDISRAGGQWFTPVSPGQRCHPESTSHVPEVKNSATAGWGRCSQLTMEAAAAAPKAVSRVDSPVGRGRLIRALITAPDCRKAGSVVFLYSLAWTLSLILQKSVFL